MTFAKVYIASGLTNHVAVGRLRDALAELGIGLTYDWTAHGSVWAEGLERIREVSEREADGVMTAALCVVLLPGGRGTHAELGIAIGAGTPVLLVSPEPIALQDICAFYRHPSVAYAVTAHSSLIVDFVLSRLRWLGYDIP